MLRQAKADKSEAVLLSRSSDTVGVSGDCALKNAVLNEKSRCFWEFDKNKRAIREEAVSVSVLLTSCLIRRKKITH